MLIHGESAPVQVRGTKGCAMRISRLLCLLSLPLILPAIGCGGAPDQRVPGLKVFTGARIIDGTGREPVENGVLVVRDGRIEAAAPGGEIQIPRGAEEVSLSGRTVIPGIINSHGHVGGTLGLRSGPDVYSEENILRQLALYARYGVTTVVSLGDDGPAGIRLRDAQHSPILDRARLYLAGPVVSSDDPEDARRQVRELAEMKVDFVKIRVDDFLGTRTKMPPDVYRAVIDEAHQQGLRVAAHMYSFEDAQDLLRSGVDFLAHSIRDREVDEELISLIRERGVCLCPTLTREVSTYVYESTPDFFQDPFFLAEADPEVLRQLQDPDRQRSIRENPQAQHYKQALEVAGRNLKALKDAGIPIAFGTDSGPPARFQGYFEHLEMELMARAGLTPMQILISATSEAARCLNLDGVGSLESGNWADFVVLSGDPLEDIRNARNIESVWIAGNRVPGR